MFPHEIQTSQQKTIAEVESQGKKSLHEDDQRGQMWDVNSYFAKGNKTSYTTQQLRAQASCCWVKVGSGVE